MTTNEQQTTRKPGTPGRFSRWMQRTMNARTSTKIRRGKAQMMGMDLLILKTTGRRSGEPRETPLAWFPDGDNAWLVVASGGGGHHPDWHANLTSHPDEVSVEFPGGIPTAVTPQALVGADREHAWERITTAQPRYAKYQKKSDRQYPVVRLTAR